MKKLILLFLFLITVAASAQKDGKAPVYDLIEAERSFAKASVALGRKEAFTQYLAEGSVIFTDKWIRNGKEFSAGRPAVPSILKWEPEYVNISAGRDFGLSTGPWESQEYRPGTGVNATGYYVSVWEKQKDGGWKVILDAGTATPPPVSYTHEVAFPVGDDNDLSSVKEIINAGASGLSQAEKDFTASLKNLKSKASSFISSECRMMLQNKLPITGLDLISLSLDSLPDNLSLKPDGSGISRSGDMAFTYGYAGEDENRNGNYLIIWQKDQSGEWKVILLMINI